MEPTRQGGLTAELSDALERTHERVLRPILCQIGPPTHPVDESIHTIDVPSVELAFGDGVVRLQSGEQLRIAHGEVTGCRSR